jgi:3-hydroxyacyl-CoA dehydrogenase
VLYDYGMAMGPMSVGDLAGLDVGWRIRKEYKHLMPQGERQPLAEDRLCELGRYGQKTKAGWYAYGDDRSKSEDPEVERIVRAVAAEAGIEQRAIDDQEVLDRCLYALVNEGARILEEGFALRAVDIDIIYLYGYGFPAFRGGPMWYADTVGLDKVYARVEEFHQRHGYWWRPAPLLAELAGAGKTFAQWDKDRA